MNLNEPIAIIGSSCRFPGGASNASKLWDLLHAPRDLLSTIPPDRFDPAGFYHPNGEHHGASNVQHSYLLDEDPRLFDAPFFSLNAREAEAMDPQHRILLETVYECLETAGVTIQQLQNTATGVYVGLMTNDYHDIHLRDMETIPKYTGTGTTRSILSNRVSYFFNWKGPSMTIDTACSSSLVAVHLAVQSLRSGETPVAIAAGTNLIFGPEMYVIESKLRMLSPHGRSRMWDSNADGYGRGEGVAAVMLKPLAAAIRDGDAIECIIRETGVNQDGRTPGITMPSSRSQEALIRQTYRRAGLDLARNEDRPQFFEAHGTGTAVGDPLEAEAISRAFFGADVSTEDQQFGILHVGGIKTIIGHLEGAAGIAGLLKASLAIQNKIIPPNLHLDELNPRILPFTGHLRIPTEPIPWPSMSDRGVRRASVNSFGFGGTNAHAILESFDEVRLPSPPVSPLLTPLVFSANSDASLVNMVKAFAGYLKSMRPPYMLDLAWTLQAKRTELPYRKAFAGSNLQDFIAEMEKAIQVSKGVSSGTLGTRSLDATQSHDQKILGIFTGQGAQWPSMGAGLLQSSDIFAQTIQNLEDSLRELPDKPTWSLRDELSATGSSSRVHLAEISQPLCTAVQLALVDLLNAAGVRMCAVVGHSSGEIGAAYAAGVISARDAIRIAYYRGVHAKHAAGKGGQSGSMMAAGVSFQEAQSLCDDPRYAGRISVAASNAPSTVTISGDKDAIEELKTQLDQKQIFARVLKVDKAYHSHHMLPCAGLYRQSLDNCAIEVRSQCGISWVSSVYEGSVSMSRFNADTLSSHYWVANMTQPVLFSQAVQRAIVDHGPFDVAIEIGPHAALKGPTTQTIKACSNHSIPYHGTLDRGNKDTIAFSSSLGFIWERLGAQGIQLDQFTRSLLDRPPILQKGLPGYQWDHKQTYWKESRLSKNFRMRKQRVHELLGIQSPDHVEGHDLRWRNILRVDEMPWLRGHKFQNEILFPAAGHVALALEASKVLLLSAGQDVRLIELERISIGKAITLDETAPGVETCFSLRRVGSDDGTIVADFACYACANETTGVMDPCSSGRLKLYLGVQHPGDEILPTRPDPVPGLVPVDSDEFYESMIQIGLDYTGEFRHLQDISRTRRYARSSTRKPVANPDFADTLMVHPALLDMCFQTVIAAFCHPGDGSLWTPYLPTSIERIRINPQVGNPHEDLLVDIEAHIVEETSTNISGNLSAYNSNGQQMIQLDALVCKSFAKETSTTDRLLFAETDWKPAVMPGEESSATTGQSEHRSNVLEVIEANERVALYYLRTLREKFPSEEVATFAWWYQRIFDFADHLLPIVANGSHSSLRAEWLNDTYETVQRLVSRFPDQIDLQLVVEVGENLPTYVRGTVPLLEVMMKEDRLTRLYQEGLGVPEVNRELSSIAKQLSHQYPNMRILEIGAGTGGMTREVLQQIGGAFGSYTFTDISTGFFEKAQESLQTEHIHKIVFSALDIEKDPEAQGYAEGSYDVIIASNVLHATRRLGETVSNVRRLLRPGGYLLLNEVTGDMLRLKFIMSGLPGWWLGADDGRLYAPTINPTQWDQTLSDAGFSGVDIIRQDFNVTSKQSLSVIASQAVDAMVDFLREPLLSPYMAPEVQALFIVGGKSLPVRRLARSIARQLSGWTQDITFVDDLLALEAAGPDSGFTVICLDDLDEPVLQTTTPEKLQVLQFLFSGAKHILYLTRGSRDNSPYSMAMYGLGRTMLFEHPNLQMQFIDIRQLGDVTGRIIAEDLLRLVAAEDLDPSYLWTVEPEIAYVSGQKQIQRLVANQRLNNQLNSSRRLITESVRMDQWQLELIRHGRRQTSLQKRESRQRLAANVPSGHVFLDILLSLANPVGYLDHSPSYLSIGRTNDDSQQYVVMSSELTSSMVVPMDAAFAIPEIRHTDLAGTLRLIGMRLMAQKLLSLVQPYGFVVLHEPDSAFATIALHVAAEKDVHVALTTTNAQFRSTKPWIWLHPFESTSTLARALPSGANLLVSFAVDEFDPGKSGELPVRIANVLGKKCLSLSVEQLRSTEIPCSSSESLPGSEDIVRYISWAHQQTLSEMPPVLNIREMREEDTINGPDNLFPVVSWRPNSPVTVPLYPTVTDCLFSPHKTYVLFGLSGEIGRSLTDYMVEKGARYIVLTSRRPPTADAWVERHQAQGVIVMLQANDVTQKQDVIDLIAQINATMPPIGGIVNGAMVLQDKLFSNMTLDDWNSVVRPKIEGSRNLDDCFSAEKSLEFFIMLSSLASVIGNSGQSNYNAGNMYCCALAANRRQRGLAASVLDIGKIVGIGYVARNRKAVIALRSHKFQPISESLFHHMFAEAVISGRPDSGRQPVLTTGMQKRVGLADEDSAPPLWLNNPRFAHMKWEDKMHLEEESGHSASVRVPVKDQLDAAKNVSQAEEILCSAFATRLATILQMSPDSLARRAPLVDIGIDSLIAVEVRSWFLKELNVDVPVLKVIGGASILDVCRDVLPRLSLKIADGPTFTESPIEPRILYPVEELQEKGSTVPVVETAEGESSGSGETFEGENSSLCIIRLADYTIHTMRVEVRWDIDTTRSSLPDALSINNDQAATRPRDLKIIRSAPLSHAQQRMWMANLYTADPTAYNVAFAWRLKGTLDVHRFESALGAVLSRHEALHTAFRVDETTKEPKQIAFERDSTVLQVKDIKGGNGVHAEFVNNRNHVFDLVNGETITASLIKVSPAGPALQCLDYAIAERERPNPDIEGHLKYWKQQFRAPMEPLPLLPLARVGSRVPLDANDTFTAHAFVKKEVVAQIKESSRQSSATSFHFYAAALQVLLYQLLSGSVEEFCFGVADANRHNDRYVDTVGFFMNLLPVRLRLQGQQSFAELLKNTKTSIYGALAHSKVPFGVLLEKLKVLRSSRHNPLFQVLLNYTLGLREMGNLASCQMDMVEIQDAATGCDLVVSIVETVGQDTAISFTMQRSMYLEEDCRRIINIYVDLLAQLSQLPGMAVNQSLLHPDPNPSLSLDVGRGPRIETWKDWTSTVSHQVDVAMHKYASDFAVKMGFSNEAISYAALDEEVGKFARALADLGVVPSSIVAILAQPSISMIVSILAILRVGGTYLPLDPRNPHGRLSSILTDSSPLILLCDGQMEDLATGLGTEHKIPVKQMASLAISNSPDGPYGHNLSDPDLPAFILYTSGSTGAPKGIALNHRNWINQFAAVTGKYNFKQEVVLQQSSPGFDMAIEQIFIALCNGGTIVLAPGSIRGDSVELSRLIMEENVTYTMAVPSEYLVMLHYGAEYLRRCHGWKYAFCGGEKVTDRLRIDFKALFLPQLQLINVYGPTETTVSCCRGVVPLDLGNSKQNHDFCPVGQVLPNYHVYIIGPEGHVVPTGFPGEIHIGGVGVGKGYLTRPEESRRRFLPASSLPAAGLDTIYRTGDRGRLLDDGSLVFLGRIDGDSQIKLRGQRVDLDDIAHTLLNASKGNLANARVSARGSDEDIFLVAFVVFSKDCPVVDTERRAYLKQLRQTLPLARYMCPAAIIPLTEFPLGVNGKIDGAALNAIDLPATVNTDPALTDLTEDETALLALWQEVLPTAAVAGLDIVKDTDFFEAGGNSLSLVRLQASIEQRLGPRIPLVELVDFCSLQSMARRLRSAESLTSNHIVWEDEAAVPDISELRFASLSSDGHLSESDNNGKVVVLTGASGFLGQHILQQLIDSSDISEIHCIAVRSSSSSEKLRAFQSPKITIYSGDLCLPRLGLDPSDAESLATRADIIIHNGADVSFLKSYSSLKKANVDSTAEVIRLSALRRVPIQFVSSAGVAGFVPRKDLPLREISVAAYPPASETGSHGYQAAKWVSERLLEKASKRYGMKVIVHRPTGIIGKEAPRTDILRNFLHYSQRLGTAPDMDGWDGYFDLVDVGLVAQRLVAGTRVSASSASSMPVQVVHTCNEDAFPVQELGVYLEQKHGTSFGTLPMLEWIERAVEDGMDEMVGLYLREVTTRRIGWYPRVTSDARS
ncbi:hypothetical protein EYZ11_001244 [Aspergillus tanneri]|uniref:Nonribosomal peptide synthetases (NRPS) n=1 Tax=Aspergillus tanneri TaxID=1220188 RepID=A0A4S3JV15_9EURO|nr:hypothetical protein EYZ11_001244 [Aspergillus tanneri]